MIEFDNSEAYASLDLENGEVFEELLMRPFTEGWSRRVVMRFTAGVCSSDVCYFHPSGIELCSLAEIKAHLTEGLTLDCFSFNKEPLPFVATTMRRAVLHGNVAQPRPLCNTAAAIAAIEELGEVEPAEDSVLAPAPALEPAIEGESDSADESPLEESSNLAVEPALEEGSDSADEQVPGGRSYYAEERVLEAGSGSAEEPGFPGEQEPARSTTPARGRGTARRGGGARRGGTARRGGGARRGGTARRGGAASRGNATNGINLFTAAGAPISTGYPGLTNLFGVARLKEVEESYESNAMDMPEKCSSECTTEPFMRPGFEEAAAIPGSMAELSRRMEATLRQGQKEPAGRLAKPSPMARPSPVIKTNPAARVNPVITPNPARANPVIRVNPAARPGPKARPDLVEKAPPSEEASSLEVAGPAPKGRKRSAEVSPIPSDEAKRRLIIQNLIRQGSDILGIGPSRAPAKKDDTDDETDYEDDDAEDEGQTNDEAATDEEPKTKDAAEDIEMEPNLPGPSTSNAANQPPNRSGPELLENLRGMNQQEIRKLVQENIGKYRDFRARQAAIQDEERARNQQLNREEQSKMSSSLRALLSDYIQPFECGWLRELVYRVNGPDAAGRSDVYYYHPSGRKLRSIREITQNLTHHLKIEHFTFRKEHFGIGRPFDTARNARMKKETRKR